MLQIEGIKYFDAYQLCFAILSRKTRRYHTCWVKSTPRHGDLSEQIYNTAVCYLLHSIQTTKLLKMSKFLFVTQRLTKPHSLHTVFYDTLCSFVIGHNDILFNEINLSQKKCFPCSKAKFMKKKIFNRRKIKCSSFFIFQITCGTYEK